MSQEDREPSSRRPAIWLGAGVAVVVALFVGTRWLTTPSAAQLADRERSRVDRAAASASAYARENDRAFAAYVAAEPARKAAEANAAKWTAPPPVKRTAGCADAAKRLMLRMHVCGLNTNGLTPESLCERIDTERVRYAASLNCPEIGTLLFNDPN